MAPRKRTTKQQKADPRAAKLQAFIEDFDSEVATRVSQMRAKIDKLLLDVDNSYDMALMKQPRAVRQMPWMEFYKLHLPKAPEERGSVEAPQAGDVKSGDEAAILESVVAEDHAALLKSLKRATRKKGAAKSSSDDENVPTSSRKGPAARRPPSTAKRTKVLSVTKQHAAIRCSSRKPLVTPARNMMDSSLIGQTPLVTPRFDPRLPKTPAVRVPRHKERVYSISANGSPITAGSQDIVLNFPVGNGESIQLLASEMDSLDLNLLDETALRSIRQLKDRLTTLCGDV